MNTTQQPVGPIVVGWKEPPYPSHASMHGRYCRLEALNPDRHASRLFAANSLDVQNLNWTYLPYGPFQAVEEYRTWMEKTCRGTDPLFYAIIDLGSNEPVGVASYLRITPSAGSIEVGHIHFSPKLQKTRAATEAMYLMMSHVFELGYRRCEWKCDALNAPSRAAALRLGFSFEGIFRQATIVKGRNRDTAWYAAMDFEWPILRNAFQQWLAPSNFDENGRQRTCLTTFRRDLELRASSAHQPLARERPD